MKDKAVSALKELQKAKVDMATHQGVYPAIDELTLLALERRHLEIPALTDVIVERAAETVAGSIKDHLWNHVRLMRIAEVAFDTDEPVHLPGVESAITTMRGRGFSLIFLVQGDATKTSVYLGLSRFAPDSGDITAARDGYEAVWKANFPGTTIENISSEKAADISHALSRCEEVGLLTGIPSLKREEQDHVFVQGLERMIRAMRGKTYTWLTVADPMPQEAVRFALDQCRSLQSDIHQLVNTNISKAVSNGKTVMLGLFGMGGRGDTAGTADTLNETKTTGTSIAETETKSSTHSGLAIVYGYFKTKGSSKTNGTMEGLAQGWANTVSNAVTSQLGGGGFTSIGMTWTKTTTVGQEFLNRKAQYAEEVLKAYEKRLQEGTALGMWSLGHYFCAENPTTYNHGIGVVTSLFSGMDSHYEPPRTIKVPKEFTNLLRLFQNVYLQFENKSENGKSSFEDHPLGSFFNGPATPVNTRELAVATPLATRDVEGVSVSKRPSFGINAEVWREGTSAKSLTVGMILDKGNETRQKYRIALENLPKHLAVFGLTGSGKTNTVKHLLTQLWKIHRIPFLVIEPAKAEYRALSEVPELANDLLVVSAGIDNTGVCPLRLNPFDFDPGKDSDANRVHILTHIDRLKATFNASFPMYASMPYILEEAILEVYRERGWNLGKSTNRHCDIYAEDFRDYIPTLHDLWLKVETITRKKGYYVEQQMNIEAALKARLSSLMVGSKGTMLNCARSIPSADLFSRPCIIELENMGDDDEKAFLMGLLVSKLYEYRKATFTKELGATNGLRHLLVIEEAHRLLTNVSENMQNSEVANVKGKAVAAFVDMLSEIRAFGQSAVVVDQLPSRVSPNIIKGTGSKIIHRLLAKDDREAVGWTLGLNAAQIDDLSLLRVGECITGQDGDRKAFMCKVEKNDAHENAKGGETSPATEHFKEKHSDLFEDKADSVDLDDASFANYLHKAMLAIAIGEPPAPLFAEIKPSFAHATSGYLWDGNRANWLEIHWIRICSRIWGFYGGSFGAFLAMRKAGLVLMLTNGVEGMPIDAFRAAFKAYIEGTKTFLFDFSTGNNTTSATYEQLLLRHKVLENLNNEFDRLKTPADGSARLAVALRKILPLLLPAHARVSEGTRSMIASEIVERLQLNFSSSGIVQKTVQFMEEK